LKSSDVVYDWLTVQFVVGKGRSIRLRCDIMIARGTPQLRGLRDLVFFLQGPRSLTSFLQ
jgi:hypothetical protein